MVFSRAVMESGNHILSNTVGNIVMIHLLARGHALYDLLREKKYIYIENKRGQPEV